MLDNLFDLVKGLAGDAVVNNPDVPNEHNDAVVAEATNTVAGGLQNMLAGGGLQNIISMFTGGGTNTDGGVSSGGSKSSLLSNPIVNMMIGHFAKKLMQKFGLGGTQASSVSNNLIPNVISNLISKTNDPNNNSFTLDNLLNSLTGGSSQQVAEEQQSSGNSGFNFQDLIGQFTGGGGGNSGGGGGFSDIISKITSGAQNAMQGQGGGGLMDIIKGFIK
jgi:hypothetical protein